MVSVPLQRAPRASWIILLAIVIGAALLEFLPVWIIQPFKPQSDGGLALSYAIRRWAPVMTIIALVVALIIGFSIWRRTRRWWVKALLVFVLLPLMPVTWFARQNHFEWLFHPLPSPTYAHAGDASFVADTDVLLAVECNGEAAAYPIRFLAYHHVMQDVVGGTPITVTY